MVISWHVHPTLAYIDLDDAESAFPIFNIHVRVSVHLSKSDFFSLIMQVIIKIQSLSVVICSLTVKCNLTKSCIIISVRGLPKL